MYEVSKIKKFEILVIITNDLNSAHKCQIHFISLKTVANLHFATIIFLFNQSYLLF